MARPKKGEEKAKAGATLEIDVDSFVRTRDSVVTCLATLQDALQTLSTAYIKHTNAVLGEHGAGLDLSSALSKLGDNPLLGGLANLQRPVSPARITGGGGAAAAADAAAAEKKERKKRQHDPNAPKRPLTQFFLYMQTARPIIAEDLGSEATKGAVAVEGTRRWKDMPDADRQLWTNAYKDNLRLYNARMHAYKVANNLAAKDMTDEEAFQYAEQNNIGYDTTADAQLVGEATAGALQEEDEEDVDAEGEPEKEATPPPKPTPKSRKPKAPKGTPAAAETITPVPTPAAIVPSKTKDTKEVEKEKTPAKRKRAKKAAEEPAEPVADEREELAVETPKSVVKPRKKKSKAEA